MSFTSHFTLPEITARLKTFVTVADGRFEDYQGKPVWRSFLRDVLASIIVALVAIPLCVGLATSAGMTPEHGIAAGAVAGILGGLFSGSKYQVSGPSAALITIIAGVMQNYGLPFLIMASVLSGGLILVMGVFGLGKYFRYVPHSIIVGFTIGLAIMIALSQMPDVLGGHIPEDVTHAADKLALLPEFFKKANAHALFLALLTFYMSKQLYKISVYIPAPLIAIILGTLIANFVWHDHLIALISTKYGSVGEHLFLLTPPSMDGHPWTALVTPILSITFIAALESLLSARMADRLAGNKTPYNPDKELFCQGLTNIFAPLCNGMLCTGALARTATNIRAGGVSPFSPLLKGVLLIVMMTFFAQWLSFIPMACIGGLLVFVAVNMVKGDELKSVIRSGAFETFIMVYTAFMTVATDLAIAVGTGTSIYYLVRWARPTWCTPLDNEDGEDEPAVVSSKTTDMVTL